MNYLYGANTILYLDIAGHNFSTLAKSVRLWLSPYDHEAMQSQIQQTALPKSESWLLKDKLFTEWSVGNQTDHLFWVRGSPGTGKTFLVSSLIHKLQSDKNTTVFYFYFEEVEANQNSADALVRSFLVQMMNQILPEHSTPFMGQLIPLYRASCEQRARAFEPLWNVFIKSLSFFTHPWCVIDGLNECKDRAKTRLLDRLTQLAQSRWAKIFVSSQDENDISDAVNANVDLGISIINQNKQLIDAFIDREVLTLKLSQILTSADIEKKVVERLKSKSEGSFLWYNSLYDNMREYSLTTCTGLKCFFST